MPDSLFSARAPSNIALIKYMGKADAARNLPENGSVSMTLDALCSVAELERVSSGQPWRWVPELPRGAAGVAGASIPDLSEKAAAKALAHVERTVSAAREIFAGEGLALASDLPGGGWILRTANTFPQASGIASSASSFAAITAATALACVADRAAFERAWIDPAFRTKWAKVSRLGSGSSCRSFHGPFVRWEGEEVSEVSSSLPRLAHFVLLISDRQKAVSSSEAHLRVKASPLWSGRVDRVNERIAKLTAALAGGDLGTVARVAWSEAWEMHSLFHTCEEPFTYWEPGSIDALRALAPALREASPPIVTMDAGPNVHVLVDAAHAAEWEPRFQDILFRIHSSRGLLRDGQGTGARF